MNEHDYFRELIRERAVNDAAIKARACVGGRRTFAWRRVAMIAAISAAVLIGTVFLIPTTRAEVLRWFSAARPADYLTANEDERMPVPALDELITTPAPNTTVPKPSTRPETEAGVSEDAKRLSAFLRENSAVTLGGAMFDGQTIWQSVRMDGLSGLYLWEQWTGCCTTAVRIDEQTALTWGEDGGPFCIERDGETAYVQRPLGSITYELPDGTRFGGSLDLTIAQTDPFLHSKRVAELRGGDRTAEGDREIDALSRSYLEANGITAYAAVTPFDWERYTDADGNMTVRVIYTVWVDEAPPGAAGSMTELFRTELGTIAVNMRAWETIEKRSLSASEAPVRWTPETRLLTRTDYLFDGASEKGIAYSYSRYTVDMDGVAVAAEAGGTVDALGIHGIRLRIATPATWTDAQREALAASLWFDVLIDGEAGGWLMTGINRSIGADGSVLWTTDVENVPYDRLSSVRSVTFVPSLNTVDSFEVTYADGSTESLAPKDGETVKSGAGITDIKQTQTRTVYPDAAITLTVGQEGA